MRNGCCLDRQCTPDTCMNLPEGVTCGDCRNFRRCQGIFGCKAKNIACDWFPRRFAPAVAPAGALDSRRKQP